MGTFANFFKENGCGIPENKKDEFAKRIEKIFIAGGMMEIEQIQMYGKKIFLLRKVSMKEQGMNFIYNYFEDDWWENAGFNIEKSYVWSEKIGWKEFRKAVVAAYVLQEIYTDGIAVAMVNGYPVTSLGYVGWINYLFNEKYHVKNFDPWKLFEACHYSETCNEERMDWYSFGNRGYSLIGGCEIYAVLNGYKKAIEVYDKKEKEKIDEFAFEEMKKSIDFIKNYKNIEADKKDQLQTLIDIIYEYYENDEMDIKNIQNENIRFILEHLEWCDMPAFIIKVISEIYDVEFWDVWEKIRHIVKRKTSFLYGNEGYYIVPITTEEFFKQSPDDMILYWKEGCDIKFSEELLNWFITLKEQYDNLLCSKIHIDNTLRYILDLLEDVNDNYYRIYAFSDFFEETLENLNNIRYQILWKIFDNMIHDPEMKRAGDVIFIPDEPEHKQEDLHYFWEKPKRRLIGSWDIMDLDKKKNKARVTLRRYMALMSNRKLRYKVFGV